MNKKGSLIVISGPSGCGKGTIVEKLIEDKNIEISVSCTTRNPRPHEKDGVNYFFKTQDEFDVMVKNDDFLEYANVFGCSYGTPKQRVLERLADGKNVILEIDVQGAMQVKQNYPQAIMIFIMPPSEEELLKRLRGRATETEEQINKRFGKARSEMALVDKYDYKVVNDDLDAAVAQVKEIINSKK
ncbi:MAG: guanylate kinase [Christensenellaceae bacterium]